MSRFLRRGNLILNIAYIEAVFIEDSKVSISLRNGRTIQRNQEDFQQEIDLIWELMHKACED